MYETKLLRGLGVALLLLGAILALVTLIATVQNVEESLTRDGTQFLVLLLLIGVVSSLSSQALRKLEARLR